MVAFFVALPGIEPGSGASETLILSIVLQGQGNVELRMLNLESKTIRN